jgi:hypothetical protein
MDEWPLQMFMDLAMLQFGGSTRASGSLARTRGFPAQATRAIQANNHSPVPCGTRVE